MNITTDDDPRYREYRPPHGRFLAVEPSAIGQRYLARTAAAAPSAPRPKPPNVHRARAATPKPQPKAKPRTMATTTTRKLTAGPERTVNRQDILDLLRRYDAAHGGAPDDAHEYDTAPSSRSAEPARRAPNSPPRPSWIPRQSPEAKRKMDEAMGLAPAKRESYYDAKRCVQVLGGARPAEGGRL